MDVEKYPCGTACDSWKTSAREVCLAAAYEARPSQASLKGDQRMSRLEITVDAEFNNKAALLLNDIWDDVCLHPQGHATCAIKDAIDYVLVKTRTKTWPYILMTQLLGKATDERVNILAMHKNSVLDGAWDARSLCEHVISRDGCFEPDVLCGILGGVKQPYNNSPAQKPELAKTNNVSPAHRQMLNTMVDALSSIATSDEARDALGYFLYVCKRRLEEAQSEKAVEEIAVRGSVNLAAFRRFLCGVAQRGRDGEGLNVAVAVLLSLLYREEDGYSVNLYPSNVSRRGGQYQGDLELYRGESKLAALELKDKPFSSAELQSAARDAWSAGFPRFLFVFGYGAGAVGYETFSPTDYEEQEGAGVFGGCVGFESLVDSLLLVIGTVDLDYVRRQTIQILSDAKVKARISTSTREELRALIANTGK